MTSLLLAGMIALSPINTASHEPNQTAYQQCVWAGKMPVCYLIK